MYFGISVLWRFLFLVKHSFGLYSVETGEERFSDKRSWVCQNKRILKDFSST